MTLDQARDAFEAAPTPSAVKDYLITALTYWHDDMISDETFGDIVRTAAHTLPSQ